MAGGEDDQTQGLERKVLLLVATTNKQLWTGLAMLLLMIAVFVVGVVSMAANFKSAEKLLANVPENRAVSFSRRITKVHKQVEKQYAKYLLKMEDKTVFELNQKFELLYELSQQSESAYSQFVSSYQKSVYQLASKVKGSGEWYYYYDQDLKILLRNAQHRKITMQRYFADKQ